MWLRFVLLCAAVVTGLRPTTTSPFRGAGGATSFLTETAPSECATVEACDLEASELFDAARTLNARAAELRSEASAAEAYLARMRAEAPPANNILPLTEAAAGAAARVWRTTLRVVEEERLARGRLQQHQLAQQRATLVVAWTFLAGGVAEAAPSQMPGEEERVAAADDGRAPGWTIHRAKQGRSSSHCLPDILECWLWVRRGETLEKLLLRTTCMPVADAERALDADKEAKAKLRQIEMDYDYKSGRHEWSWTDPIATLRSWIDLCKTIEKKDLLSAVSRDRAHVAQTVGGERVDVAGETWVLGKIGDYRFEGDAPVSVLASLLPQLAPPAPEGRFTTW